MPNRGAGGVSYRYGFNGKETENDVKGIGNEQDYGMRIYDPRLGRFLSVDPMVNEYPELTPYQFSSNRPIDGIDLDGLEYTPAQLKVYYELAKSKLETLAAENSPAARGMSNAIVNANSLGLSDKLGSWGTDNVDDYSTDYEKSQYLWGRVAGDALSILQGLTEISSGSGAVMAGGAVSTTGVGAIVGGPTALTGLIIAGHGTGTVSAATVDLTETFIQLKQLGALSTGVEDAGTSSKSSPEQSSNDRSNSAHGNTQPTQQATTLKKSKVQKSRKVETVGNKYTKVTEVKPSQIQPGQSRAKYVRYKTKDGRTIRSYKDSYDRANKFKHRKPTVGNPEGTRPNAKKRG